MHPRANVFRTVTTDQWFHIEAGGNRISDDYIAGGKILGWYVPENVIGNISDVIKKFGKSTHFYLYMIFLSEIFITVLCDEIQEIENSR